MCHFRVANIIYKYPQISSTASSHGLKMLQRTVSHISESILIAALICRVLCVTIKKTNSKIQNCRLCIVGPASGWRPGGDPKSFVKKHIPVVLSTCTYVSNVRFLFYNFIFFK